jgi:hypothetical protein
MNSYDRIYNILVETEEVDEGLLGLLAKGIGGVGKAVGGAVKKVSTGASKAASKVVAPRSQFRIVTKEKEEEPMKKPKKERTTVLEAYARLYNLLEGLSPQEELKIKRQKQAELRKMGPTAQKKIKQKAGLGEAYLRLKNLLETQGGPQRQRYKAGLSQVPMKRQARFAPRSQSGDTASKAQDDRMSASAKTTKDVMLGSRLLSALKKPSLTGIQRAQLQKAYDKLQQRKP